MKPRSPGQTSASLEFQASDPESLGSFRVQVSFRGNLGNTSVSGLFAVLKRQQGFIFLRFYFILCVCGGMYVCMYVYHMCAWYLRKPEEGVGSLGTGVTGSFEPPCCCWELNPGPLLVLLSTKPSVQPPRFLLTQKGDLLKVNLLLMTPFSIRPMFYTLHLRKLDQGVTPSNSPLRQADAGIGEFMMSQLPLDCRLQDLSEVNTESNAVDKTLQMA